MFYNRRGMSEDSCYKEAAHSLDGEVKNQFAFFCEDGAELRYMFLVAHIKVEVTPKILKRLSSYDRRDNFITDEELWLIL